MPLPSSNSNIARHLSLRAAARPHDAAIKVPRGRTASGAIDYVALSFVELETEVAAWSQRLTAAGVRRGDRTLVMVRQGLPLIGSVFALFSLGAVPVVIDPGMGLKNFLSAVQRTRPRALVGIPLARVVSHLFRGAFRSVAVRVGASGSLTARLTAPGAIRVAATTVEVAPDELAAILFTSGSTGAPKGVVYEHGMFDAQVRLVRDTYGIAPGEIDLPLLPIFALFNPALGMTTIVPEIDPRRPAEIDPAKIVQAIRQEKVTNSFGSPTLWRKIGDHCVREGITLPTLRRVLCAGAPVPAALWEKSRTFLPAGRLHSPYGATEALPVASVSADEIDPASTKGACVGRPVGEMDVRIIALQDRPIASWAEVRELPPGEIGEIVVRGPVVTKAYDAQPEATAAAKIAASQISNFKSQISAPRTGEIDEPKSESETESEISNLKSEIGGAAASAAVWHRMGDCGYRDAAGLLWFCGRKVERVETARETLHTEPCEQVFRSHPQAQRCALIGLGERPNQIPALVVEATPKDSRACRALTRELRELALQHAPTRAVNVFFFHPKFPVDVRHNAKIHRLTLARWAATAKGFQSDPKR